MNVPDELLRDLLPGPVTLVLQRSEELNKDLNPFTSVGHGYRIDLEGQGTGFVLLLLYIYHYLSPKVVPVLSCSL